MRSAVNAQKLCHLIETHCGCNPFEGKTPLKSLVSSTLVEDKAKNDILQFADKGQKHYEAFVSERLISTSKGSVWDKMKKLNLKTFSNWMEDKKVRIGEKVLKLREERELLGRFLIIQGSRPNLVPKLEETIGEYEMSVVPRSLCAGDGTLHVPSDKASLMHAVEQVKAQEVTDQPELIQEEATSFLDWIQADLSPQHDSQEESATPHSGPDLQEDASVIQQNSSVKVLIVDAMAVLQSMKKTTTILTLSDLQNAFNKRIKEMMTGYDEGRVVFDRYMEQSLKNKTREKRATTSVEYEIHPRMKLTMSIKNLLSASSTKKKLTCLLGQGLLEYFSTDVLLTLFVVYDTSIKGHNFADTHTHEEADILIPHQILATVAEDAEREICVWSPDTDVLLLLLDLVSCKWITPPTTLKFSTGKGTKKRQIDVFERVQVIGQDKCQGLLGIHNFSGADWGGEICEDFQKDMDQCISET